MKFCSECGKRFEKTVRCKEKGWTVIKIDEIEENIDLIKGLLNG